jgi:PAS domain S-box-containing protein
MPPNNNAQLEQRLQESEQRFRLIADTAPVLIWMSGTDKLFTYFNKPWLDFTGRSMQEELGIGWTESVHPDDLQRCLVTYTQSFDQREGFRMEYRLRRRDGEYRWLLDIGVPRFNQDRSFAGYIGIAVDVHDRKLAEEKLNEYEKAVEGVDAMITVIDRQYRYVIANQKHLSMRGKTKEQVLGHHAREIMHSGFDDVKEKLDDCFRGNIIRFETKVEFPDVGERDMSVSFLPVNGPNGIDRIACIGHDITERKRAEEALRNSEESLRLAIEAGRMYAYEWDVSTNLLVRSPEYVNILGPTEPRIVIAPFEQVLQRIHPDDGSSVVRVLAECSPEKPTIDLTYRVLVPGKGPIWLKSTGRAFFDGEGRMLRLIGMVADVTDQKLSEEALSDVTRKLAEAQEKAHQELRQFTPRLIAAQEDEKRKLSRELHDDIAPRLTLLRSELDVLERVLSPDETAGRSAIRKLEDKLDQLVVDVHNMSHHLHSWHLEHLGLSGVLEPLCRQLAAQYGIAINLTTEPLPDLPGPIPICFYRVAQEALSNAGKHSKSTKIDVGLFFDGRLLRMRIRDYGVGFDPSIRGNGLGLVTMQERLRMIDGVVRFNPVQEGTEVEAEVTLDCVDMAEKRETSGTARVSPNKDDAVLPNADEGPPVPADVILASASSRVKDAAF